MRWPYNGKCSWFPCTMALVIVCAAASFLSSCQRKERMPSQKYFDGIFTHAQTIYLKDHQRGIDFMDSVMALYPHAIPKVRYRKYAITRNYYFETRRYDTALIYSDSMLWEVMDHAMEDEYVIDYSGALFLKGDVLFELENYSEAFEYYYKAREIIGKLSDNCNFSDLNSRLGMVCYRQERFQDATGYFTQAYMQRSYCDESYWRFAMQQHELSNIGLSYYKAGMKDSALLYYNKTLEYIRYGKKKYPEKDHFADIATAVVYGNLGTVYYDNHEMAKAEAFFKESIRINSQKNYANEDAQVTRVKLVRLYLENSRLPEAFDEMKRLEASLTELPDKKVRMDLYKLQSDYYSRTGQPQKAFEALNAHLALKDFITVNRKKLMSSDFDKEFEGMETRYQLELFKKKHELNTAYLVIMIILSVMTGIILFLVWKNWKRSKKSEIELMEAKKTAEQAAMVKQDFLSHMSHEIRTPMNAVIGMTHLLLNEDPKPEQRENLDVLKFSSENLLILLNDILDYSKIEAGKITFEYIDFNLKDLIKNLRLAHQLKAEEKDIQLAVNMDAAIPDIVVGDPVRLAQILNNLLSNAIKFTSMGSVILEVKLQKQEGNLMQLYFGVTDTGIGIDVATNGNIFESFTQATSDTTRRFGGTGLGLAITRRLLQLQNSDISLWSEPGKGSVFSFTLQLSTSKKTQQEMSVLYSGSVLAFNPLSGYKVLVVDDSEMNIMVASKFLKNWDLEVDSATGGIAAINKIKNNSYDLVLMDLQMPEMSGYEASRQIRSLAEERFRRIPIIALSADIMPEAKENVVAAGMNDYISKPFNPHELYGKIARYLYAV